MLTENSFKNSKLFMYVLDDDLLSESMGSMMNEHKSEAWILHGFHAARETKIEVYFEFLVNS